LIEFIYLTTILEITLISVRHLPHFNLIKIKKNTFFFIFRVEIKESFPVTLKNQFTVHVGPPPDSGIILAYILRILDGMLPAPDAGLDAHRLVEAFKFGFGERSRLGDSKFVKVSEVCII
jgi:gamma-glutamyltranspeptidase